MRTDIHHWAPLSVPELCAVLSDIPVTWCIAGGWALDLHGGKQTREHGDIDVILLREQQRTAFRSLSQGWQLHKAEKGKLARWEDGEYLTSTKDIWVCKDNASPWAFQVMLAAIPEGLCLGRCYRKGD